MRRKGLLLATVFLILVATTGCGKNQVGKTPETPVPTSKTEGFVSRLVLGGGAIGGTFNVLATAQAESIKKAHPGTVIDVPPGGTISNILRLATKEFDVAWVTLPTLAQAYKGIKPPQEFDKAMTNLRGIARVYDQHYQFVVPKSFPANTVEEIFEKRMKVRIVPGGPRGHIGVLATEQMLNNVFGTSIDKMSEWGCKVIYAEFAEACQLMQDGQLDVFCPLTGAPNSSIMELSSQMDIKLLPMRAETIKKMEGLGYTGGSLKSGVYKGVEQDIPTIIASSGVATHDAMPDNVIYEITKLLCENKEALANAHAVAKDFKPEEAWKGVGAPLHPGAEKYYREKEWLK